MPSSKPVTGPPSPEKSTSQIGPGDAIEGEARGAGHAERGLQAVLSLRNRHGSLIRRNRNIKKRFYEIPVESWAGR